jgi:hypothetical protein
MIQPVKEFQMNIFKDFTLKWWQAGIFKLVQLSLGIIIGSTWPELFKGWTPLLFLIFLISGGYVGYVWWKQ